MQIKRQYFVIKIFKYTISVGCLKCACNRDRSILGSIADRRSLFLEEAYLKYPFKFTLTEILASTFRDDISNDETATFRNSRWLCTIGNYDFKWQEKEREDMINLRRTERIAFQMRGIKTEIS